jgi:hypothetical protein
MQGGVKQLAIGLQDRLVMDFGKRFAGIIAV